MSSNRILVIDDSEAIHEDIHAITTPLKKTNGVEQLRSLDRELFGDESDSDSLPSPVFRIDDAYSGLEAIEMFRTACLEGDPYSVVFTDVRMPPGIDGILTVQRILSISTEVEIVICTAFSDYSWEDILAKLRVADRLVILRKPFEPVTVKQLLLALTTKWEAQRNTRNQIALLEHTVRERTRNLDETVASLRKANAELQETATALKRVSSDREQILRSITSALIGVGANDKVRLWNKAAEQIFGVCRNDAINKPFLDCGIKCDWVNLLASIANVREEEKPIHLHDLSYTRPSGESGFIDLTVNPLTRMSGEEKLVGFLVIAKDVTERRMLETQRLQANKLESIGQLAAGIAHEINTPIQFVSDNTRFLRDSFNELADVVLNAKRAITAHEAKNQTGNVLDGLSAAITKVDVDYLLEEIPAAIEQSLGGLEHVTKIVRAMKDFSYPSLNQKTLADLNKCIENTLLVAKGEWKYVAEIETTFEAGLPLVPCFPGDINQVILNVVINAAHAIEEAVREDAARKGRIEIATTHRDDFVEIKVADNGIGISETIKDRIFDPFFTTKEIGKGSGQGLAISRNVVVERHNGSMELQSEVGKGTTFFIRLPLQTEIEFQEGMS
jgi:PAS domain S-box-containing protein